MSMEKLIIEGPNRLFGEVPISGSKNASLPVIAATLLASTEHVMKNVPQLADIDTMFEIYAALGMTVTRDGNDVVIDTRNISSVEATYDMVRKMRASVLVLGPLLARFGRARVSLPGGCAIGARPIDMHLKGLEALGATIVLEHGYVDATAPSGGLIGGKVVFDMPSVTATENVMMAATLARGTTFIENAACEPEIVELAEALNAMGARVYGAGNSKIQIDGVDCLNALSHRVGPDRIEAGTFIAAASITGGDIVLRKVRPDHMESVMAAFLEIGTQFEVLGDRKHDECDRLADLRVIGPERMKAKDLRTSPYPGFPTDMQAQFLACMTMADGISHIEETIFENRFMHTLELMRMGADISMHGNMAVVKGQTALSGAPVMATDLRASASLIVAALAAQGTSEVLRIYHLDRGYVCIEKKLSEVQAKIRREKI
jgi:UDP-N-acetylglucosamine 1-carboxyvinyltransferase